MLQVRGTPPRSLLQLWGKPPWRLCAAKLAQQYGRLKFVRRTGLCLHQLENTATEPLREQVTMGAVEHDAKIRNVLLQADKGQHRVSRGQVNDCRHVADLVQKLTVQLGSRAVERDGFHSVICAAALRLALVLGG